MDTLIDLSALEDYFVYISAFLGAFLTALWISIILWAFRDIRARSRDRLVIILATIMVALFNIPGLLIYLIIRPKDTLHESYQRMLEDEALLAEIETNVKCPGCGSIAQANWQVCPYCYTRIHKLCTNCGRIMQLAWQMCPYCAAPTPGSPAKISEPESITIVPDEGQEISPPDDQEESEEIQ
jgi:RNA polymerase subunit RPABC4/transcription elongation factor Spt4